MDLLRRSGGSAIVSIIVGSTAIVILLMGVLAMDAMLGWGVWKWLAGH